MVSAYAAGLRLTLATRAAKARNGVDAALEVIGLIDLKAAVAMLQLYRQRPETEQFE